MESKDLWVELKLGRPSYIVLKGTYGEKIHKTLRISRQGVRWRFYRLFNHVYVEAFETILFIEKVFGTQLREYAIRISKEKYALRQEMQREGFQAASDVLKR
jgi:DNA-binding Lrp family transcriptional regulator